MTARLSPCALLAACSVQYYDPPADSGLMDDSGWTEAEDTGARSAGEGQADGPHPDRPVVEAADAWCYLHETGDTRWIWAATATATDPQGTATLRLMATDGITVFAGDEGVGTQALVCDTEGACTATWGADEAGMSCDEPQAYTLLFVVQDEDAQRSEPFEVTGRLGSGPEG